MEHKHLIIRAEVNKPIVDVETAKLWLAELVQKIGMVICKTGGPHADYVEKENNCGIAAIVMIETSHISLHLWDKITPPLLQADVYSCAPFDPSVVIDHIQSMEPTKLEYLLLDRERSIEECYGYKTKYEDARS